MLRYTIPFKLDPRRLNLKCDILRPSSTKTATRNSKGEFVVYAANRWFGWLQIGGTESENGHQDVSVSTRRIFLRRDDRIESGWAIRYPKTTGDVFQIYAIDVFEDGDRRYMTAVVDIKNSATVVAS